MAKFTLAENIFDGIGNLEQSVGSYKADEVQLVSASILEVFEPDRGVNVLVPNPRLNDNNTSLTESLDNRKSLGTFTLNDRDFWENNNFNETTFESYLKDNLETVQTIILPTPDGDIVDRKSLVSSSPTFNYSIDAVPFVINPKNKNMVRLDRYWDKEIHTTKYNLATEGKINYYLYPRHSGRTEDNNIEIFNIRGKKTGGGGKNRFDFYASQSIAAKDDRGYYLFGLDWGDGSPLEYTNEPKLLESTVLFEHFYEKPGFYSITGVVYVYDGSNVQNYEKFQTNILLNPSLNYESNLYGYDNFASIGGISRNSKFVKSLYNIMGINPLPNEDGIYDTSRVFTEAFDRLNQLDKIDILNTLSKINYDLIPDDLRSIITPYQGEIDGVDSTILGCMDYGQITELNPAGISADNYNPSATVDDGSCVYQRELTIEIDIDVPIPIDIVINPQYEESDDRRQLWTIEPNSSHTSFTYTYDSRDFQKLWLAAQVYNYNPNSILYYDYNWDGFYVGDNKIDSPYHMYASFYWTPGYDVITAKFIYIDDTPPPVIPTDMDWVELGGVSYGAGFDNWGGVYNLYQNLMTINSLSNPSKITSTWGLTYYTTEDSLREIRGFSQTGFQPIWFTEEMHSSLSEITIPQEDSLGENQPFFLGVERDAILLQWYYPSDIIEATVQEGIRYSSEVESFNIYRYRWDPITDGWISDNSAEFGAPIASIPANQPTEWLDRVIALGNDFINANNNPTSPVGNDANVFPTRHPNLLPSNIEEDFGNWTFIDFEITEPEFEGDNFYYTGHFTDERGNEWDFNGTSDYDLFPSFGIVWQPPIEDIVFQLTEAFFSGDVSYPSTIEDYGYFDKDLAYGYYIYELSSVDANGNESEKIQYPPSQGGNVQYPTIGLGMADQNGNLYFNSRGIMPTPTDNTPNPIVLPDEPLIHMSHYTIQLRWNTVDEYYTYGIEGDFGSYRITVINNTSGITSVFDVEDITTDRFTFGNSPTYPTSEFGEFNANDDLYFQLQVVDGTGNTSDAIQLEIVPEFLITGDITFESYTQNEMIVESLGYDYIALQFLDDNIIIPTEVDGITQYRIVHVYNASETVRNLHIKPFIKTTIAGNEIRQFPFENNYEVITQNDNPPEANYEMGYGDNMGTFTIIDPDNTLQGQPFYLGLFADNHFTGLLSETDELIFGEPFVPEIDIRVFSDDYTKIGIDEFPNYNTDSGVFSLETQVPVRGRFSSTYDLADFDGYYTNDNQLISTDFDFNLELNQNILDNSYEGSNGIFSYDLYMKTTQVPQFVITLDTEGPTGVGINQEPTLDSTTEVFAMRNQDITINADTTSYQYIFQKFLWTIPTPEPSWVNDTGFTLPDGVGGEISQGSTNMMLRLNQALADNAYHPEDGEGLPQNNNSTSFTWDLYPEHPVYFIPMTAKSVERVDINYPAISFDDNQTEFVGGWTDAPSFLNQFVSITFNWNLEPLIETTQIVTGDTIEARLIHAYNPLITGNQHVIVDFGSIDAMEVLNDGTGSITMNFNNILDGNNQLSYIHPITSQIVYPNTFIIALYKNGDIMAIDTSGDPNTIYGSDEITIIEADAGF